MTPAQQGAVQACRQLLAEHFDAYTLTVRGTDEHDTDAIASFFHGPFDSSIGLTQVQQAVLDQKTHAMIAGHQPPT